MQKRTVLVTGGNRGIGLATVNALANRSELTVLMGARNTHEAEKTAPDGVFVVEMDLSSPDSVSRCGQMIIEQHGPIDVLVNNAGVLHEGDILETDWNRVQDAFQVNVMAPIHLIKLFLPQMRENGYGRIVNVSSGWGSFNEGLSGPFSYSTSKAALNAVTFSVSHGLPSSVKINSVCPGWVRTRMGGDMATRSPEQGADSIAWLATLPDDGPSGGIFRDRQPIQW